MLVPFALGTAAGDLATEVLGLGFLPGGVIFASMIALASIAFGTVISSLQFLDAIVLLVTFASVVKQRTVGARRIGER